jgi:hypothetical protein
MSNYHVKKQNKEGDGVRVVFHIAVPAETNAAGKNLSDCVKEYFSIEESAVPWLVDPELAQVLNGEVFEYEEEVNFSGALTVLQKRNIIDSRFTSIQTVIQNRIRREFDFWGLDRNVT